MALVGRIRHLLSMFFSRVMRISFARRCVLPIFPPAQMWLLRVTGGRFNITELLVPSLILEHVGAKSGIVRHTPLMCFPRPDGSYLIAGSNWGQPTHPAWTANLLANPGASITVRRRTVAVTAALLSGAEREAAWPVLEAQWPGYREYERIAGRKVRIFRLTLSAADRAGRL